MRSDWRSAGAATSGASPETVPERGYVTPEALEQHRRPHRPLERRSSQDGHARLAAFVIVAFALGTWRDQADRPERRQRRRVAHGRPHHPGRRLHRRRARARASRRVPRWCSSPSKTLAVKDPPSAPPSADAEKTLAAYPEVTKAAVAAAASGAPGLTSKDRHAVMIECVPKGTYEEGDPTSTGSPVPPAQVQARHAGVDPGVGRRVDREGARRRDPGRARQGRHDLDPADDHHPDVRARVARRRARAAAHLDLGRWSPRSVSSASPARRSRQARASGRSSCSSVSRRRRLRAVLHAARARGAGRRPQRRRCAGRPLQRRPATQCSSPA